MEGAVGGWRELVSRKRLGEKFDLTELVEHVAAILAKKPDLMTTGRRGCDLRSAECQCPNTWTECSSDSDYRSSGHLWHHS